MRTHRLMWTFGGCLLLLGVVSIVPTAGAAEQPVRINFLHFYSSPSGNRAIESMVEAVNAGHPAFVVQVNHFEHESFKAAILAMLSGNTPPDLFSYWAGARVQALVDAGYLEPIDDLWDQIGLDQRFGPAITRACTYNGRKYVIPLNQYYVAFFYNTAIFEQHGLSPPATWAEFLAVCETLKAAGVTPLALGARERWPAQFWFDYLLLRTAGPAYRRRLMTGRAAYTDPEVRRVYQLWKELLDRGYFNPAPRVYDAAEAARLIFHGQAAMTLMGNWMMALFDGPLGWDQQSGYDFFPFPVIEPEIPVVALGPLDCLALPRARKAPAAKTVLPYFSEIAPQQAMSRATGSLSPNQQMPASFYTPLQHRLLQAIQASSGWAFNYDLATPPPVAEVGLQSFADFLEQPARYPDILAETARKAQAYFAE